MDGSLATTAKDDNGKDTVIRMGGNDVQKESDQQLAGGPLYAAFEMNYEWRINNKPLTIKQQISIWGRQFFYESRFVMSGAPKGTRLVTVIADFCQNTVDSFQLDKASALLSHGKQSENKDELGLAIVLSQQNFDSFTEAPKTNSDVTETHLAPLRVKDKVPLTFRFYSCWSQTDERFLSANNFTTFMQEEARKFSEPPVIKWN